MLCVHMAPRIFLIDFPLSLDKERPAYAICKTAHRSVAAQRLLVGTPSHCLLLLAAKLMDTAIFRVWPQPGISTGNLNLSATSHIILQKGGMDAWRKERLPEVKGDQLPPAFVASTTILTGTEGDKDPCKEKHTVMF
jgi:hypothetical protein